MTFSLMPLALIVSGTAFCLKRWGKKTKYQGRFFREASRIFPVLVLIGIFRSTIYEPFVIPTGSMIPTLQIGENILVSRYAYNIKIPGTSIELAQIATPSRGDVVVFKYPPQPNILYIKRVLGVPGDVVKYESKRFYVNGEALSKPLTEFSGQGTATLTESIEGRSYTAQIMNGVDDQGGEWRVPEGQYFVVGDNRDDSRDSRVWGMVPERNLIGKAEYVWMKTNGWKRFPEFSVARAIK